MASNSPRNMQDWIRIVERNQVQLRGMAGLVSSAVETVKEEQAAKDSRTPTFPVELVYQTGFYIGTDSRQAVRFILDFPDVTKATDGTDIEIAQYELWGRDVSASALDLTTSAVPALAMPGATLPGLAATPSNEAAAALHTKPEALVDVSATSSFRTDGFKPGSIWEFRARAIGKTTTIPGLFSETVTVIMEADSTPPPQPTAPRLTVQRGTITATWDGQAVTGPMPADFKYAVLAHGTGSSPTKEIARFGRDGGFKVIANIEYYDPQFFRLQAVDESGNRGPWSEQGVGYTTPLVDTDIILSTIDAAKTHLKNINAGVSILPNTIITEHLVVTEEMTAALANFLHVKAGMLEANEIWADEAWFGLADAVLVRSDMFEGKAFEGGVFTTTDGGKFQTNVEDLKGVKLTEAGLDAWSAGGVHTLEFDTATGNLSIFGGVFTGSKIQSSSFDNTGWKLDITGLKMWNSGGDLTIDATPTGSTFTGTLRSGFGTTHAAITDNAGRGRPGLMLPVNTTDFWQPQLISAGGAEGWASGTLMAVSARTYWDSWYSQLALGREGAGWSLGTFNGTGGILQAIQAYSDNNTVKITAGNGVVQASSSAAYMSVPGAVVQVENGGAVTLSGNGTTIYGGLNVSGSKNFVMDHPTKEGMELLHGATESPVSGVQYWGCSTIGPDGTALVELPEYFEALVKPGSACIAVNGNGVVVGWDDEVVDNSFTVTGPAGAGFTWDVKAERLGADFPVEREKVVWLPPDGVAE